MLHLALNTFTDSKVLVLEQTISCPAHEEANIEMIFYICKIDLNENVTIHISNTDILIIMLANVGIISEKIFIFVWKSVAEKSKVYQCYTIA